VNGRGNGDFIESFLTERVGWGSERKRGKGGRGGENTADYCSKLFK